MVMVSIKIGDNQKLLQQSLNNRNKIALFKLLQMLHISFQLLNIIVILPKLPHNIIQLYLIIYLITQRSHFM